MPRKTIEWPPPKSKWPPGFSVHRDGWAKSHNGRTIVISGKTRTPADVAARFAAKCKAIDAGRVVLPGGPTLTLRELASAFYDAEDRKVARGVIMPRTRENAIGETKRFGKFTGGTRLVSTIGPSDFASYYAKFLDGTSPENVGTAVNRITKMFRWAIANGLIERVIYGDDWARPRKRLKQSHRVRTDKAFKPAEVGKLWRAADPMWRCWIALGFVAGFTNSDCANLPRHVIAGNTIDYRRRKTGQTRRVIVLPPDVARILSSYQRPPAAIPEYNDLFFLTERGLPFDAARDRSRSAREFKEIQQRAGTYRKGRGFISLRTTGFNEMLDAPALTRGLIIGRKPEGMTSVDWDNYLEKVHAKRILRLTSAVWDKFKKQLTDESGSSPAVADAVAVAPARSSASSKRSRRD